MFQNLFNGIPIGSLRGLNLVAPRALPFGETPSARGVGKVGISACGIGVGNAGA